MNDFWTLLANEMKYAIGKSGFDDDPDYADAVLRSVLTKIKKYKEQKKTRNN